MGVFSVYREGMDRESLRCATQILAEGRRPLVLFPEGVISRTNDRLNNMMEGTVLVARSAAKQRAGLNPPGQVVIHPVAIRYFFDGDVLHRFTAPLHAYLLARPRVADRVLAVSSFFIDLFGIALIAPALFGGALTPFAVLLLVFAFRQVCQGLCALQPPPDMIWRNPGFPSLLVTYGSRPISSSRVTRPLPCWAPSRRPSIAPGISVLRPERLPSSKPPP